MLFQAVLSTLRIRRGIIYSSKRTSVHFWSEMSGIEEDSTAASVTVDNFGETGSSFNVAKLETNGLGAGLELAAVPGVEFATECLGLCMWRKSCFGVISVFSHRLLHLELLAVWASGENAIPFDNERTSSGSRVREVAVAQMDSSKASHDAAPDITTVFCGVPKGEFGTGLVKEITASTVPSISKGLKTWVGRVN
jgi:hypothetical protein